MHASTAPVDLCSAQRTLSVSSRRVIDIASWWCATCRSIAENTSVFGRCFGEPISFFDPGSRDADFPELIEIHNSPSTPEALLQHPVTHARVLYGISGTATGIVGLDDSEGIGLLLDLKRHALQLAGAPTSFRSQPERWWWRDVRSRFEPERASARSASRRPTIAVPAGLMIRTTGR